MDGKNNGSFWPSYVDVMTTLFAITLVCSLCHSPDLR